MTDALFRQKQQSKLISLCRRYARAVPFGGHSMIRSLASPVGRGMVTLNSLNPILAEPIPIPPLVLQGRCPPTNATISPDSLSLDMTVWPEYHNGVAAGLRIRKTSVVSRNWILYNRIHALSPNDTPSKAPENAHAGLLLPHITFLCGLSYLVGFLLSLGLQGHLKVLSIADICDYLTRVSIFTFEIISTLCRAMTSRQSRC
jgi:anaphase-promoting complex subunit 1